MCRKGLGEDEDPVEAKKYFKKAADQGHAESQYNYASMCFVGVEGERSFPDFQKYLKKAAKQGHTQSLKLLVSRRFI